MNGHTNEIITDSIALRAVRMLLPEIESKDSHNKDHLLLELPIVIVLRADLPVEVQELLELLVS